MHAISSYLRRWCSVFAFCINCIRKTDLNVRLRQYRCYILLCTWNGRCTCALHRLIVILDIFILFFGSIMMNNTFIKSVEHHPSNIIFAYFIMRYASCIREYLYILYMRNRIHTESFVVEIVNPAKCLQTQKTNNTNNIFRLKTIRTFIEYGVCFFEAILVLWTTI